MEVSFYLSGKQTRTDLKYFFGHSAAKRDEAGFWVTCIFQFYVTFMYILITAIQLYPLFFYY